MNYTCMTQIQFAKSDIESHWSETVNLRVRFQSIMNGSDYYINTRILDHLWKDFKFVLELRRTLIQEVEKNWDDMMIAALKNQQTSTSVMPVIGIGKKISGKGFTIIVTMNRYTSKDVVMDYIKKNKII